MITSECGVPDCRGTPKARGWCNKHLLRWYKYGDPLGRAVRPTPAERFWAKVNRGAPDECWPWTAALYPKGYGQFNVDGRAVLASRFSWELHHGPILGGLWMLHRCDNPPCVNPAHLFLGTSADNIQDMVAKGRARGAVGTANRHAKLTPAEVREIRHLHVRYSPRFGARALAARFGVTDVMVSKIARDEAWRYEDCDVGIGPVNPAKDFCGNGHPIDEANTYRDPRGRRGCRACNRDSAARYQARKKLLLS